MSTHAKNSKNHIIDSGKFEKNSYLSVVDAEQSHRLRCSHAHHARLRFVEGKKQTNGNKPNQIDLLFSLKHRNMRLVLSHTLTHTYKLAYRRNALSRKVCRYWWAPKYTYTPSIELSATRAQWEKKKKNTVGFCVTQQAHDSLVLWSTQNEQHYSYHLPRQNFFYSINQIIIRFIFVIFFCLIPSSRIENRGKIEFHICGSCVWGAVPPNENNFSKYFQNEIFHSNFFFPPFLLANQFVRHGLLALFVYQLRNTPYIWRVCNCLSSVSIFFFFLSFVRDGEAIVNKSRLVYFFRLDLCIYRIITEAMRTNLEKLLR